MAKNNNQGKQPKPQRRQGEGLSINESIKSNRPSIGADTGGPQRSKKGTAGDGTSSTGPRKTE